MIQFYFLSIVLNATAGYILISKDESAIEFKSGFSLKSETSKLVLGILSLVIGLMKLLSVYEGDVPVAGDLFPALAGFFSGFILIFEYYRSRSTIGNSENSVKIDRVLVANKKLIGMAALLSALLHFLFPKVLLL